MPRVAFHLVYADEILAYEDGVWWRRGKITFFRETKEIIFLSSLFENNVDPNELFNTYTPFHAYDKSKIDNEIMGK